VTNDVSDQTRLSSAVNCCYDHDVPHQWVGAEHTLDFAGLDPKTPNLNLIIASAKKLEIAVGQEPGHITRAVETRDIKQIRKGRNGLSPDKALPCQLGPFVVSASHAWPGDIYLTDYSDWYKAKLLIK
jgi:hypothetical protein